MMKTDNMFAALVKHDMKLRGRKSGSLPRAWRRFYLLTGFLIALGLTTYASLTTNIQLSNDFWYMTIGFVFAVFGMSIGLTRREWKNGTVGWWLTLPLPRTKLVLSKMLASLIRGVSLFVGLYVIIAIFTFYVMILSHSFTLAEVIPFLAYGLKMNGMMILFSPLVAAVGVMFAILTESKMRPVIGLVWIFWIGFWVVNSVVFHFKPNDFAHAYSFPGSLFLAIMLSWVLSYVLLRVSAYLLDRQLNM